MSRFSFFIQKSVGQNINWLLAIVFLFLGCGPKIPSYKPPMDVGEDFSISGKQAMPDRWWTVFEDEELNVLIDSALQVNFDLASTWQQFLAAKATVAREASIKWPQIDASAQTAENFPVNDLRGGENTQLGLSASYEVNLWGRIRTGVQG